MAKEDKVLCDLCGGFGCEGCLFEGEIPAIINVAVKRAATFKLNKTVVISTPTMEGWVFDMKNRRGGA